MKQFYPKDGRVIFHVDMNSFYASVEIAFDPSLKGKPVAIAGNAKERRGIIVTSSYEARAKGVKTTMPIWEAKKHCPELIVMTPNFDRYRKASLQIFQLLREYTPLVEPVSIDEGYMDISACYQLGTPLFIAQTIQTRLLKELNLPCSIGIAPNKFLAKMASDMKKPLGITVLRKREVETVLWPLKVGEMHGVGQKTAEKLNKIGIITIGDLARSDVTRLKASLGINGEKIYARANGIDHRPVDPDAVYDFKSIGNSTTLPADTINLDKIKVILTNLADSVARRMAKKEVCAETIQITIRYFDRKTVTRSQTVLNPISSQAEIYKVALILFTKHWNGDPVRLLGVTAQQLLEKKNAFKQLDLFNYKKDEKKYELTKIVDQLRDRFGEEALLKGSQLAANKEDRLTDKKKRGTSLEKDFFYENREQEE
ncbi:DNA polymerase IV [Anaerobacillus isosaccharinicus]|uniref:DNA polymerase IV n=1 Tax=Anaerobacillus isosaccharinicus TaxID=1532552 RepID=A0A1S2MGX3_9BACI|nr:DNA polymerase IV [Anaerobacillus isosaccharinicus]MBA5585670.1 DNA polymerase IV [Anaerobacillus isosaccharinicus]QOY36022.1 DNA polymerase IV [Anaerobacillus isosaccharinicus]